MKVVAHRAGDLPPLDVDHLRRLARWGRHLRELGVAPGASGNLSVRADAGFVITRTEVELGSVQPDDWVLVTGVERRPDGALEVTYLGDRVPSRDAFVHGTVYRRTPAARAVFHLHDGQMLEKAPWLGIPSTERYYPAGTSESVAEIEHLLDVHPGVDYFVLVDHGIVAWAEDIDSAGAKVEAWHRRAGEIDA